MWTAALVLSAASPVFGDDFPLAPRDCEFIATYDRENEHSFASDFAHMAHFPDATDECSECVRPLRKRTTDFTLSVFADESRLGDMDQFASIRQALTTLFNLADEATDTTMTVLPASEVKTLDDSMFLVFLVENANRVAAKNMFPDNPGLHNLIDHVLLPESTCSAASLHWTAESQVSAVVINVERRFDPDVVAICTGEEAYNSMGLWGDPQGDGSLFANERWRGEAAAAPEHFSYGERDGLMLKLLYRDEFDNGQDYDETRAEVEAIIANECVPR